MTSQPESCNDSTEPVPIEYCARCRYSLLGLPSESRCPECGSRNRRVGRADEASSTAVVALALGVISAALLFLGPLALATLVTGPAAVLCGAAALWSSRRALRPDLLPSVTGILLGGGACLALVAILAFAFFLTTP